MELNYYSLFKESIISLFDSFLNFFDEPSEEVRPEVLKENSHIIEILKDGDEILIDQFIIYD